MTLSPDSYTVVESRALLDHAWVRVIVDTLEHAGRRYPCINEFVSQQRVGG